MGITMNGPGALALGAADAARAVAAIKARLRLVSDEEADLIVGFAETALGLAERVIGQATIVRTMMQDMSARGGWQPLGARPVRAIDAVIDRDGAALPVGAFAVDIDGDGVGWVRADPGQSVRITFRAGMAADWDGLPSALRDGAAMLAAHLFDDRTGQSPIPAAVSALWRPYLDVRLAADTRSGAGA